jgi:hypothetical protein
MVDTLIDWYEENAGDAAVDRVIYVSAAPSTVRKFARREKRGTGPLIYRNRVIVPLGARRQPDDSAQLDVFVMLDGAHS